MLLEMLFCVCNDLRLVNAPFMLRFELFPYDPFNTVPKILPNTPLTLCLFSCTHVKIMAVLNVNASVSRH
jgi:hypothetical protein